jgi:hypothetical protein
MDRQGRKPKIDFTSGCWITTPSNECLPPALGNWSRGFSFGQFAILRCRGEVEGGMKRLPRFSVKLALVATTLIALGLAMLYQVLNYDPRSNWPVSVGYFLVYGGSASIGAGIFAPFKRPLIGAVAGMVVQAVIIELT